MPDAIHVTDHAILRYLERALGFDIEALRRGIADKCAAAIRAGAASKVVDGIRYEFRNGAVVTITKDLGGTPSRTRKEKMVRGRK